LLFTTADDVHMVSLDGPHLLAEGYAVPSELPIHTETLRYRRDVQTVVHAHPPAMITADLAGLPARPTVGAYSIPAIRLALAGRTGLPTQRADPAARAGRADARSHGWRGACALRGHGVTTVGATIAQAVIHALNLEALANITLGVARACGQPSELSAADIAELPDLGTMLNEEYLWRHHLAPLEHAGLALSQRQAAGTAPREARQCWI
jgi:ribulose-5-phosphate 4-epimerase/fuculose-1-phosphate aldolase